MCLFQYPKGAIHIHLHYSIKSTSEKQEGSKPTAIHGLKNLHEVCLSNYCSQNKYTKHPAFGLLYEETKGHPKLIQMKDKRMDLALVFHSEQTSQCRRISFHFV